MENVTNLEGQRLGPYIVGELLGEGGVAFVHRGRHENGGDEIAIKVLKSNVTDLEDIAARFKREAQVAAILNHPNIIKVFDYGEENGITYLTMQLLMGTSLATIIERQRLPLEAIERLLDSLASALDYAHQRRIIHRDLKPQNVLFDQNDHLYLCDFGMVKPLLESRLTRTGIVVGTPAYMSPEQIQGETVDTRSDIYSLGVMLFELLTGELPFVSSTVLGVMAMHCNQAPPRVSDVRRGLPPGIDEVVNKALAKTPDARFASAGEMVAAFRSALAQRPPSSRAIPVYQAPPPASRPTPVYTPPQTPESQLPSVPNENRSRVFMFLAMAGVILLIAVMVAILLSAGG